MPDPAQGGRERPGHTKQGRDRPTSTTAYIPPPLFGKESDCRGSSSSSTSSGSSSRDEDDEEGDGSSSSRDRRGQGCYIPTGQRKGSSFYKRQKTSSPPTSAEEGGDNNDLDLDDEHHDHDGIESPAHQQIGLSAATGAGASNSDSSSSTAAAGSKNSSSENALPALSAALASRLGAGDNHRERPDYSSFTSPLRFSFGASAFTAGQQEQGPKPEENHHSSYKSSSAALPSMVTTTGGDNVSLPSYSEAMEQSVELRPHSPEAPAVHADDDNITASLSTQLAPTMNPAPTLEEQLAKVKALKDLPLKEGESWAVLQRTWMKRWSTKCSLSGQTSAKADAKEDLADDDLEVGPVETGELADVARPGALKMGMEEGIDFEVVPMAVFAMLTSWYGRRGPLFERKVVAMPASDTLRIELYPPVLEIYPILAPASSTGASATSSVVMTSLSTLKKLSDVKSNVLKQMSELEGLGLGASELRFWRLPADSTAIFNDGQGRTQPSVGPSVPAEALQEAGVELIAEDKDDATLAELQIDQAVERLALEVRRKGEAWTFDEDGKLVKPANSVKGIFAQDGGDYLSKMQAKQAEASTTTATILTSDKTVQQRDDRSASPGTNLFGSSLGRVTRSQTAADRAAEKQQGTTGLYNLGNTCFMNAALQCLSNTPELKDYFVSGVYKSEINADNPLGMGGALAKSFGELLAKLWNSGGGAWHPREFKMALSRFSPQFIGYQQQDTQELLAFLLDGLHEDLNRIVKKPYIEAPDWEGGGTLEMVKFARRQWDIYKLRNDSVIVDLFQGQYKSTLVCPECGKVSIKFDPFMYLTLPIPNRKVVTRKLTFIPWAHDRVIREVKLRVTGDSSMGKIKDRLAHWFDTDARHLIIVDFFKGSFYKVYSDYDSMFEVTDSDTTIVYEVPSAIKSVAPPPSQYSFARGDGIVDAETKHDFKPTAVGAHPESESIVMPVFTAYDRGHSVNDRYMSRNSHDFTSFGLPFFVSVPKAQANDPTVIQEAVLGRYKTLVKDCAESQVISECLESLREGASGTLTPDDWDMLDDTPATTTSNDVDANEADQSDVVLPLDKPEDETITEISNGGQTVNIIPDHLPKQATEEEPAHTLNNGRASKKQKCKQLFSVYFSINRDDRAPIPLKGYHGDDSGEELTARLARISGVKSESEVARSVDVDSEMGSPGQDSAEEQASVEKELLSSPTPLAPANESWPLIYPGGALTCVWSSAVKRRVFDDYATEALQTWDARPIEAFVDPELQAAIDEKQKGGKRLANALTIEDCLDEFTKEEKLGEEDPWYCPQCKDFRQATKKFDLWKVPDILVVHLKRFRGGRVSRDKIDANVDFPIKNLNLEDRVEGAKAVRELEASGESLASSMTLSIPEGGEEDDPLAASITSDANDDAVAADRPIYDLYAVDHHYGGLGGGHYTASAMNPADQQWYYFDDSSVRPIAHVDEVKASSAYLLFYRRRTTRPIGGKSREKINDAVSQTNTGNNNAEGSSSSTAQGSSSTNGATDSASGFGQMDGGGGGGGHGNQDASMESNPSLTVTGRATTSLPGAWDTDSFEAYGSYTPNEAIPSAWNQPYELNDRRFRSRSTDDNEASWSDGAAEVGSSVGGISSRGSTATSELSTQSPEDYSMVTRRAKAVADDGNGDEDSDDVVVTTDTVRVVGEDHDVGDHAMHAASTQSSPSASATKQSASVPTIPLATHLSTAAGSLTSA